MLQDGFYNKCAVIVHFEWQNWEKEVISLHVGLRVKYRKTENFCFSVYSVIEMKILLWELRKKDFDFICKGHLVTLGQVLGCRYYAMMDPKDLL